MGIAGVAGSVRIKQLTVAGLTLAEKHGKRQDSTSKHRMISQAAPVTSTGLDLGALYKAHIDGAFIPAAKSKAMHMIVQFPKALVDGDDGLLLLKSSRRFVEGVFGDAAVFGDRVDRDEKGRHVVDLFLAPRYLKRTRNSEKIAVSMTRHLKELAQKHGRPPTPHGIGRALQDEFFEFMRDDMGLAGVQRGEEKPFAGPDWKSAESMDLEGLQSRESKLNDRAHAVGQEIVRQSTELDRRKAEIDRKERDLTLARTALSAEQDSAADHQRLKASQLQSRFTDLEGREERLRVRAKGIAESEAAQASADAEMNAKAETLLIEVERLRQLDHDLAERDRTIRISHQELEIKRREQERAAGELDRLRLEQEEERCRLGKLSEALKKRELRIDAFQRGVEAFASGKLTEALMRGGEMKLRYLDKRTRDEIAGSIRPAFELVWNFVSMVRGRIATLEAEAELKGRQLVQDVMAATEEFRRNWHAASGPQRQALEQKDGYRALATLAISPAVMRVLPKDTDEPSTCMPMLEELRRRMSDSRGGVSL